MQFCFSLVCLFRAMTQVQPWAFSPDTSSGFPGEIPALHMDLIPLLPGLCSVMPPSKWEAICDVCRLLEVVPEFLYLLLALSIGLNTVSIQRCLGQTGVRAALGCFCGPRQKNTRAAA